VAAWVIGVRNALRAVLAALLEPIDRLRAAENAGDYTARLAMLEELKAMPVGAVWDYHCLANEAPVGAAWLTEVKGYESRVLSKR
jgi:L-rhamnose isomerase